MPTLNRAHAWFIALLFLLSACAAPAALPTPAPDAHDHDDEAILALSEIRALPLAEGEKVRVIATTSIIGDVVRAVAGDAIELTTLMAAGQDPHAYQPTAADLTTVSNADLIFVNGWDLEEGLVADLERAAERGVIIPVSAGIVPLESTGDDGHDHRFDPHVWFDTANVTRWTMNIESVLSAADPANAPLYAQNGAAYRTQLETLEQEIRAGVAQIPAENRKLVTNHDTFAYFAAAYGFEIIGTLLPGASTGAEPSAADLTTLIQTVRAAGVPAIFTENTVGAGLAEVLVEETGTRVYTLYTDALSPAGSSADSYLGMMRANLETIVSALRE